MSKEPINVAPIDFRRIFEYGNFLETGLNPTQIEHARQFHIANDEFLRRFPTHPATRVEYELPPGHLFRSDLLVSFHLPDGLDAPRESLGIITSEIQRIPDRTFVMPNVLDSLRDRDEGVAYAAAGLCTSFAHHLVRKIQKRSSSEVDTRIAPPSLSKSDFKQNSVVASRALGDLYYDYYGIPIPQLQGVVVNCREIIETIDGEADYSPELFAGGGMKWARHCAFGWLGCDTNMYNTVNRYGSMKYTWASKCSDQVSQEIESRIALIRNQSQHPAPLGNIFVGDDVPTK